MNKFLRAVLLVLAFAAFVVFFSFNIVNIAGMQSVTVGQNLSPWFRYSRVRGLEKFTEKWDITVLSWSAAGLPVGIALLVLRSRIKG